MMIPVPSAAAALVILSSLTLPGSVRTRDAALSATPAADEPATRYDTPWPSLQRRRSADHDGQPSTPYWEGLRGRFNKLRQRQGGRCPAESAEAAPLKNVVVERFLRADVEAATAAMLDTLPKMCSILGRTDTEATTWRRTSQGGGTQRREREFGYQAPSTALVGQHRVSEIHRLLERQGLAVLDVTASTPGVPFGSLFRTRVRVTLRAVRVEPPVEGTDATLAQVSCETVWLGRRPFGGSAVEGGARKGVQRDFERWCALWGAPLDGVSLVAAPGPADGEKGDATWAPPMGGPLGWGRAYP